MSYRIYIDETGTCSMSCPSDENNRYLGLTGVIFEQDYANKVVTPLINAIKLEYFGDKDIVFHRREIMGKTGAFGILRNSELCERFNDSLLSLLENLDFTVITAVIDKKVHLERYEIWHAEPYHYCLQVLLERYHWFLTGRDEVGDVMIEARSKKQDKKLKASYALYYKRGNNYLKPEDIQKRMTSKDIKLKPKTANIAGLEIADMLAYPSAVYAKNWVRDKMKIPQTFSREVAKIMHQKKYYRSKDGAIPGYGVKWLP